VRSTHALPALLLPRASYPLRLRSVLRVTGQASEVGTVGCDSEATNATIAGQTDALQVDRH
jgi:hypothetical protein